MNLRCVERVNEENRVCVSTACVVIRRCYRAMAPYLSSDNSSNDRYGAPVVVNSFHTLRQRQFRWFDGHGDYVSAHYSRRKGLEINDYHTGEMTTAYERMQNRLSLTQNRLIAALELLRQAHDEQMDTMEEVVDAEELTASQKLQYVELLEQMAGRIARIKADVSTLRSIYEIERGALEELKND